MAKETTTTNEPKKAEVVDHVRMVTEADMTADSRLLDAGVFVGQLYDFSNLSVLPKGASFAEEATERSNQLKADASTSTVNIDEQIKNLEGQDTAAAAVALRDLKVQQAMTEAQDEASK